MFGKREMKHKLDATRHCCAATYQLKYALKPLPNHRRVVPAFEVVSLFCQSITQDVHFLKYQIILFHLKAMVCLFIVSLIFSEPFHHKDCGNKNEI